jgi:hypothetical protein
LCMLWNCVSIHVYCNPPLSILPRNATGSDAGCDAQQAGRCVVHTPSGCLCTEGKLPVRGEGDCLYMGRHGREREGRQGNTCFMVYNMHIQGRHHFGTLVPSQPVRIGSPAQGREADYAWEGHCLYMGVREGEDRNGMEGQGGTGGQHMLHSIQHTYIGSMAVWSTLPGRWTGRLG